MTMPYPQWRVLQKVTVCNCEEIERKTNASNVELKNRFLEHMRRKHRNSCVMFTDGSKSEEGVGYAFVDEGTEFGRCISSMALSFTAEALAIYEALNHATQYYRNQNITICTDSKSVIQAICKIYTINEIIQWIQCRIYNSGRLVNLLCAGSCGSPTK